MPGFVRVDQPVQVGEQPAGVVDHPRHAVRMDDRVVPRRHHLAVLALARVPRRRDVGLRALEDHHRVDAARVRAPHRVGPRHVRDQRAVLAALGIDQERHVIGEQPAVGLRDPGTERMRAHQRMQDGQVGFFMGFGDVHGSDCP